MACHDLNAELNIYVVILEIRPPLEVNKLQKFSRWIYFW